MPWQLVCEQTGATLKVIPITASGEVDFAAFEKLIGPRTSLLALAHVSNALGTVVPVEKFIAVARRHGVPVLLDGAQAVPHSKVDVRALDCDFYCFSGHKMLGPTGIGILYGRQQLLDAMPPWQGGGDMILSVSFEKTTYNQLPWKFEAGTPNISGAIGLGAAIRYLERIGIERIAAYEHELLEYATQKLLTIPGLRIIGTAPREGRRRLVRDGRHPSARHRHHTRHRRRRHPHRPSLRHAGHGLLQGARRPRARRCRSTTRSRRSTGCVAALEQTREVLG